ncbi:MAG: flagellar biosynthetic protein FliQ [Myxococcota bacterium]
MSAAFALDWFREMLWTAVVTAAPPVAAVVIIGLFMAILQAATQVNDQAVAFAPKAIGAVVALLVSGAWILQQLKDFCIAAFQTMGQLGP